MTWDMEVLKIEKEYFAIIEINGEQTMMSIRATIKGNNDKISFLFDKGLNGFGYEHLKKKDGSSLEKRCSFTFVYLSVLVTLWLSYTCH
jgi:hypothetical protein